jgi:hypothetical protein
MTILGRPLSKPLFEDDNTENLPPQANLQQNGQFVGRSLAEEPKQKEKEGFYLKKGLKKEDFKLPSGVKAFARGALKGTQELASSAPGPRGPISQELGEKILNDLIPLEDTTALKLTERAGKLAPQFLTGGESLLAKGARTAGASILGQLGEEMGFGETGQNILEGLASLSPKFGKKIIPKGSQKELVEFGRRKGLTEKEIAPALTGTEESGLLAKFSPKRGRTQKALGRTKQALGRTYDKLREMPAAKKGLSESNQNKIVDDFGKIIKKLPSEDFKKIEADYNKLISEPITGDSIINFQVALNKGLKKNPQLGQLKEPLRKASEQISPNFAKDLQLTNQLYSNYGSLSNRLKPTIYSDLIPTLRKATQFVIGLSTGNYPLIVESVAESSARQLAREMLINPRFKNLSRQMIDALNKNKIQVANRIGKELVKLSKKEIPDLKIKEDDIDFKKSVEK